MGQLGETDLAERLRRFVAELEEQEAAVSRVGDDDQ
jgi:hypothetical protein